MAAEFLVRPAPTFPVRSENHEFIGDYITRVEGDTWTFSGDTKRARIEFKDGGKTQAIAWEWRKPGEDRLRLCDRVARDVG